MSVGAIVVVIVVERSWVGEGVSMGDNDEDERTDAQQQKLDRDSVDGSVERGLMLVE